MALRTLFDPVKSGFIRRLRARRMEAFLHFIDGAQRPVRILDVGGTPSIWASTGVLGNADYSLTLLNVAPHEYAGSNVTSRVGDARDMAYFADDEFDVAFSNSLIEHVGSFDDQARCAGEMMRVARAYFVQTPNYYFPIEPHFLLPGLQFLPPSAQARAFYLLPVGHMRRPRDMAEARRRVDSVRLLRKHELQILFPGCRIIEERFMGLTKSLIATSPSS